MNKNREIEKLIVRSFLDNLTHDEVMRLDEWKSQSVKNRKKIENWSKLWQSGNLVESWSSVDLDENWRAILSKAGKKPKPSLLYPMLRYAAVALLVIGLGYWLIPFDSNTTISNGSQDAMVYSLPDKSVVWLNENSSISFDKSNFRGNRSVTISGEAFFDVEKGQIPFIVSLKETTIRVLGTKFNVQELQEQVIVTLTEGEIAFESKSSELILKPGDIASYNGDAITKSQFTNLNGLGWRTGIFSFEETPLSEVLSSIRSYYDISYELDDELRSLRVTTRLEKTPLTEVIKELEFILDVDIQNSNGQLTISKKE